MYIRIRMYICVLYVCMHTYVCTYVPPFSEEMEDHELDIITGFQVSDGERHIVVLEGLKKGGMEQLWETLPHNSTQGACAGRL